MPLRANRKAAGESNFTSAAHGLRDTKSTASTKRNARLEWANEYLSKHGSRHRIIESSNLYQVQWFDGSLSGIVNLARAVDAALNAAI
jgi:hypothetical protein